MAKQSGTTRPKQFSRSHEISRSILLTGGRQLHREAPPAWGCSACMSSASPSPSLPTSEHRAPPPLNPLSPHPPFPHSPPAAAPARRDSPPAMDPETAPPAARACQRSCSRGLGNGGRLPRPEPTRSSRGKSGGPFPQSVVSPRSRLRAEAHSCPPDPPALPTARGGDTRPRMRTRAAPQPGLCPAPRRRTPFGGIRRIQAPLGKRGAAALRFLLGSSPPGTGSGLHRRVKIFSPVKFPGISGKGLGRLISPALKTD